MTADLRLPFSRDAFLDVFGIYNTLLWPMVAALWIATLLAFVACLRGRPRKADAQTTDSPSRGANRL